MVRPSAAMGGFHHDGVWWNPRDPAKQWIGTLQFDERDGALLTVTVPEERPNPFPSLQTYDLILGVTSNGQAITLIGCYDRLTHGSLFGVPRRIEIAANALIVGFHCDNPDPLLSAVSVSLRHLDDWWGRSGIESDPSVKYPDLVVRYRSTAPLLVHDDGRFCVSIRPAVSGSFGNHRASLREDIRIEIKASSPSSLSDFQRLAQACGDFLSIVCLTFCETEELSLVPPAADGGAKQIGTFHAVPVYRSREGRSSALPHMLFRFSDIEGRAPELLGAWLTQAKELFDTRALYFSGVYGQGFIEGKFLALTQAVEAFHRRFYPGLYMEQAAFETEVLEPLKAAIPASIDDSLRRAIASRLKFANEYSQRRRMRDLFREYAEVLRALVEAPETYVSLIVDHRNAFTHFPPAARDAGDGVNSRDPKRAPPVLLYNLLLRLLLESCFLKAMGFSTQQIAILVSRSDMYRQLSGRFGGRTDAPR